MTSYTDNDPTLLPDIRHLAQQGKNASEIYKALTLKGHRFTLETLRRIIRRNQISVRRSPRSSPPVIRVPTAAELVVMEMRIRGLGVKETARRVRMTPKQIRWISEKFWPRILVGRRLVAEQYEAKIALQREIQIIRMESPELRPYR